MRARIAALAAVVVLLLAGCAEIPSTGGVRPGATELPNDTSIVYVPNPPAAGASPQEIVTGFLTAASAGGDFGVARQYLASSFAAKWRPRTRILVQGAQPTITRTSDADLTLTLPVSGRVNDRGVYTTSSQTFPLRFHLVQQGGQWRIDFAPNGIVLGRTVFQKVYEPRPLQFFDPTWTRLVPDVRWFPSSASRESIVQALIAGPAGPISAGVAVNALEGAEVVAVTGADLTTVVLSTTGKPPSADTTARMQQQLIQSLLLPAPTALRLVVNGSVAPQVRSLIDQPTAFDAFVVAGGRFGTLTATGTFTEEPVLGPRIVSLDPQAVTASPRQKLAAVLARSGDVAIVAATGAPRVVDRRTDLVAPTLDQRGWVYSVPRDAPSALMAFDAKGNRVDIAGDLGGGLPVIAIEASTDGTRMLVLQQSTSGPEAFVAGIQRDADGTPTGLSTDRYPVALEGDSGIGVDATWVDDSSVAVLSKNKVQRVRVQQLGAGDTSLGELANATSIVGTLNQTYLRVRLQTGDLWTWTSNLWQSQGARPVKVSVLAVQR